MEGGHKRAHALTVHCRPQRMEAFALVSLAPLLQAFGTIHQKRRLPITAGVAHLKIRPTVVSGVDVLVRRPEGNVRVVVDLDGSDFCLGVSGCGCLGKLEAVEEHLTVHLLSFTKAAACNVMKRGKRHCGKVARPGN